MTEDDGATLGVGFLIDFGNSFGQLKTLDDLIGTTQANAVREFQKMEAAAKGAINLGPATAQVNTFANAETTALRNIARERANAEKAGEGMVRQLERQVETFGKSATELRQARAEMRALNAEQRGLTELAGRLRATSAEMDRLEASAARSGGGMNKAGNSARGFSLQMSQVGQ